MSTLKSQFYKSCWQQSNQKNWSSMTIRGLGKNHVGGGLPIPICYKFLFWFRGRYTCNVNFLALGGKLPSKPPSAHACLWLRLCTLTIGTATRRGRELSDAQKRRHADVACALEVKWTGDKVVGICEGCKLFYNGGRLRQNESAKWSVKNCDCVIEVLICPSYSSPWKFILEHQHCESCRATQPNTNKARDDFLAIPRYSRAHLEQTTTSSLEAT